MDFIYNLSELGNFKNRAHDVASAQDAIQILKSWGFNLDSLAFENGKAIVKDGSRNAMVCKVSTKMDMKLRRWADLV